MPIRNCAERVYRFRCAAFLSAPFCLSVVLFCSASARFSGNFSSAFSRSVQIPLSFRPSRPVPSVEAFRCIRKQEHTTTQGARAPRRLRCAAWRPVSSPPVPIRPAPSRRVPSRVAALAAAPFRIATRGVSSRLVSSRIASPRLAFASCCAVLCSLLRSEPGAMH